MAVKYLALGVGDREAATANVAAGAIGSRYGDRDIGGTGLTVGDITGAVQAFTSRPGQPPPPPPRKKIPWMWIGLGGAVLVGGFIVLRRRKRNTVSYGWALNPRPRRRRRR